MKCYQCGKELSFKEMDVNARKRKKDEWLPELCAGCWYDYENKKESNQ